MGRREYRAARVSSIFGRIAARYDLMNTLMSAGRHHAWRRQCLQMAASGIISPGRALDLAAGTCDFPLSALSLRSADNSAPEAIPGRWVAADFSEPMLRVGQGKVAAAGREECISILLADVHGLPLRSGAFSLVTVGFGLRNFEDRAGSLAEMARVLEPGGRLAVLDIFSTSEGGIRGRLFGAAFRTCAPALGLVVAGDRDAYAYLPESAARFTVRDLEADIESAGLRLLAKRTLALGSVAILVAEKSASAG